VSPWFNEDVTDFTILPLAPERWDDFVDLMGPNGAMQGCWCMWFRLSNADFNGMAGDPNREAMRGLVDDDCVPGLLAYEGDTAAGWVSLAPREEFGRVERSKFFQKVDDERVWSIVCFFVPRKQRGKGLMTALLAGAIDFARDRGATVLEAYPRDPAIAKVSADGAFVGLEPAFREAGFVEVARRDPKRPIMRLRL
jgi:GNAT superfamily N-acetyltransferase